MLIERAGELPTLTELDFPLLDVDGDGTLDAQTDGLLVLRNLFGFTGEARIQMFVGVEQGLYRSFEHERFPSFLAPPVDSTSDRKIEEVSGVPVTGMLPGEVTGVYSVLGDGAFLAVMLT